MKKSRNEEERVGQICTFDRLLYAWTLFVQTISSVEGWGDLNLSCHLDLMLYKSTQEGHGKFHIGMDKESGQEIGI